MVAKKKGESYDLPFFITHLANGIYEILTYL